MVKHWQLIGDSNATHWQLIGDSMATRWRLHGNTLAIHWRFNAISLMIQWQHIGNSSAFNWQLIGNSLAIQRQHIGISMATYWLFMGYSMAIHWQLIGDELATSWHLVGTAWAHGTKADWANEGGHWRANEEAFIGNSLAQSSDVIWGVSGVGDTGVSCVDTLVSATVSRSLCDIDRVTGGVDTLVSATVDGCLCDIDSVSGDVDTVLSGAVSSGLCDLDRVSRGDLVERVGDISLSRGGDAIKSGVDEYVCGVSSIMTADGLDVCGRDSVVSDETGEVVSVDDVDDIVACGDDPLLPDAVRFVDRLSVCGAGVARSDRGDTEAVVGSGVAQRGWVDRLMFADDSLRPEPPPYAMCLIVS